MAPTNAVVEPHVVEDYVLESIDDSGEVARRRVRIIAIEREERIFAVPRERRVFAVPHENRVFAVQREVP